MIGVPLRLGLGTGANVCDGNFRRGGMPRILVDAGACFASASERESISGGCVASGPAVRCHSNDITSISSSSLAPHQMRQPDAGRKFVSIASLKRRFRCEVHSLFRGKLS